MGFKRAAIKPSSSKGRGLYHTNSFSERLNVDFEASIFQLHNRSESHPAMARLEFIKILNVNFETYRISSYTIEVKDLGQKISQKLA